MAEVTPAYKVLSWAVMFTSCFVITKLEQPLFYSQILCPDLGL